MNISNNRRSVENKSLSISKKNINSNENTILNKLYSNNTKDNNE